MTVMDNIKNRKLYDYIELGLETVRSFDPQNTLGDPDPFIKKIFTSRLISIFNQIEEEQNLENWIKQNNKIIKETVISETVKNFTIKNTPLVTTIDEGISPLDSNFFYRLGIETYATYLPIHFFKQQEYFSLDWGIYISEEGVKKIGFGLKNIFYNQNISYDHEQENLFFQIAYEILLRHELLHYRIELFTLNAELLLQKPLYVNYLNNIYSEVYGQHDCLEESLANASVIESTVIKNLLKKICPENHVSSLINLIGKYLFNDQLAGYSNYNFEVALDYLENSSRRFNGKPGKEQRKFTKRALAMNYLCNQIVSGNRILDVESEIPYFSSLPDNYFLRAEDLVPIHLVPILDETKSFIQLASPKKQKAQRMLKTFKYEKTSRGKGDHQVYVRSDWDPITVNYNKNGELDDTSRDNMKHSFRLTEKEFRKFQTENKLPERILKLI